MNQKIVRGILKNPLVKLAIAWNLTDFFLDMYWRGKNAVYWEGIAQTGKIPHPSSMWLEVTMRCNLNCRMCHQKDLRRVKQTELTLEEINSITDQARKHSIDLIELTGGELFIRKDIIDILKYINKNKIYTKLNNNGTLINSEHMTEMKKLHYLESLVFSIDGPEQIHNEIRGNPKAFQKATDAFRLLGKTTFLKNISFVLMPDNSQYLEDMFKLSRDLKADRLQFMPEMFVSQKEIDATKKTLVMKDGDEIFMEIKNTPIDSSYPEQMKNAIKAIYNLRKKYGLFAVIYPKISYKIPDQFFTGKYSKRLVCKCFSKLIVGVNGDVYICPFIHKKVGNIKEQSIADIWNNEEMIRLRKTIAQSPTLLPICHNCCSAEALS
jgi:radical SAM protein with 4Fe4S-binding SPASM domain